MRKPNLPSYVVLGKYGDFYQGVVEHFQCGVKDKFKVCDPKFTVK